VAEYIQIHIYLPKRMEKYVEEYGGEECEVVLEAE
jgi:hypothetical protein